MYIYKQNYISVQKVNKIRSYKKYVKLENTAFSKITGTQFILTELRICNISSTMKIV